MSELIIECRGLDLWNFRFPQFQVRNKENVVFWLQPNSTTNNKSGYQIAREISASIKQGKPYHGISIHRKGTVARTITTNRVRNFLFPLTIEGFLKQEKCFNDHTCSLIEEHVKERLDRNISDLPLLANKVISVISILNTTDLVVLDYYGLCAEDYEKFVHFIEKEVSGRNTIIGFDNLYYLIPESVNEQNKNILVKEISH